MRLRLLLWIAVAACVALGTTGDMPPRAAIGYGSYAVLAGDFHVHSFPGDGGLTPWDLVAEAQRRRLDVIALTNHNNLWSWRLAGRLGLPPGGVIVLPGIELTSGGYHMTSIGVHAPVSWRQSPADAAAAVHAQGGLAIAAHPLGPRPTQWDDAAIDALDGFEAASSNDVLAAIAPFTTRAIARRPSLAPIGSSDFHYYTPLGVSRTFLFVTERSPAGVFEAIRSGRTVACDSQGDAYGSAPLVAAVAAECRAAATAEPAGWRTLDAVATAGTWLGVVGLVVLGVRD
jgi:predicted metal-dependent phosphoesterase TrpH